MENSLTPMIEHEGYNLILFDNLIPSAGEQVVDQGGDVADVDAAVLVAVGTTQVDARCVAAKQVVDQGGHVADIHAAVAVHVTTRRGRHIYPGAAVVLLGQPILVAGSRDLGFSHRVVLAIIKDSTQLALIA